MQGKYAKYKLLDTLKTFANHFINTMANKTTMIRSPSKDDYNQRSCCWSQDGFYYNSHNSVLRSQY
jgi:hypothetical protein